MHSAHVYAHLLPANVCSLNVPASFNLRQHKGSRAFPTHVVNLAQPLPYAIDISVSDSISNSGGKRKQVMQHIEIDEELPEPIAVLPEDLTHDAVGSGHCGPGLSTRTYSFAQFGRVTAHHPTATSSFMKW